MAAAALYALLLLAEPSAGKREPAMVYGFHDLEYEPLALTHLSTRARLVPVTPGDPLKANLCQGTPPEFGPSFDLAKLLGPLPSASETLYGLYQANVTSC